MKEGGRQSGGWEAPRLKLLGKHSKHTQKVQLLENWIKTTIGFTRGQTTTFPSIRHGIQRTPGAPALETKAQKETRARKLFPPNQGQLHTERPPSERDSNQHHHGPARGPDVRGNSATPAGKVPADRPLAQYWHLRPPTSLSSVLHTLTSPHPGRVGEEGRERYLGRPCSSSPQALRPPAHSRTSPLL